MTRKIVEHVDMTNSMMLLPPKPGLCQTCASDHELHLPHNRDSLYYQMAFKMQRGSWPSWADAMRHCSDEMKTLWTDALEKAGQNIGVLTPDKEAAP